LQFVGNLGERAHDDRTAPADCRAISRTVQRRSGSAMVKASSAEVIASRCSKRTGSSGRRVEKSSPVHPDIKASAPSSLT
jgi:hypothetical protein